jgi:hypothetical protein
MGKNHSFWLHDPRVTLNAIGGRANAVFIEENHRRPVYDDFVKAMSRSALRKFACVDAGFASLVVLGLCGNKPMIQTGAAT